MLDRLQKVDKDTNELIDAVKDFLFSVGVRTSRERAWEIFKEVYKIPFRMLIERNDEIKYQGQGTHLSSKHGAQLLVVHDIGRFELKGIAKGPSKKAVVKYVPSQDIKNLAARIKVIDWVEKI